MGYTIRYSVHEHQKHALWNSLEHQKKKRAQGRTDLCAHATDAEGGDDGVQGFLPHRLRKIGALHAPQPSNAARCIPGTWNVTRMCAM